MALFEYECPKCDEPVEVRHPIAELDEDHYCPYHGNQVMTRRFVASANQLHLVGPDRSRGWNTTVAEIRAETESSARFKRGEIVPVGSRWV